MKDIDSKNIGAILEKYFEALTTLEEEQQLRDYFNGDVAPEFVVYKPLFNTISSERESIGVLSKDECHVSDKKASSASLNKLHFIFRSVSIASIAALVILMFSIWPKQNDSLHLLINGIDVQNSELALSMAETQFSKVNSMLGKYKHSNNQLEDLNKVGEAISSLSTMKNVLKQSSDDTRLKYEQK